VICAVVFACAAAPALAADDPLLSGYSGPGGGEQVVIGSSVLPPKNGNGGIRSGAAPAPAPTQPQSSSSGGSGDGSPSGDESSSKEQPKQQPTQAPIVAAKPTYPTKVSSASGLPLSSGDLALIAVVLLVSGLVAFAALRMRRSPA
jgi:hypothetical protein